MPALLTWFPTPLLAWLFALCFWGWVVIEIGNQLFGRWGRWADRPQATDRNSYGLLLMAGFVSFWLAYAGRILNLGVFTGAGQYGGLALMAAGVAFREWAILVLGRRFSTTVAIESDHRLVRHGPYRWLRHPAYTGAFATMVGFHLVLGNWGSTLLATPILWGAFIYRINVEEQLLLATFGERYQTYMRRTWRLFPGW